MGLVRQTVWDWRAVANFAGGGTGSGLAICVAAAAALGRPQALQLAALLAALFVALGLACVAHEVGRPLRFFRVFFHPQTSWMTREALIAPLLILLLLGAAWSGRRELFIAAGVLALALLCAQARMLAAARGIPAWRERRIIPLIVVTGLAEGGAAFLVVSTLLTSSIDVAIYVFFVVPVRWVAWSGYTAQLKNSAEPIRHALERFDLPFLLVGTTLPISLLALAFLVPAAAQPLAALAGIATLVSGWELKYTIVTRAAFKQGIALPGLSS